MEKGIITFMSRIIEFSMNFLPDICCNSKIELQLNLSSAATHKEDQKLVLKTDYRLMHVKSIAECSPGAFCNTFDLR